MFLLKLFIDNILESSYIKKLYLTYKNLLLIKSKFFFKRFFSYLLIDSLLSI